MRPPVVKVGRSEDGRVVRLGPSFSSPDPHVVGVARELAGGAVVALPVVAAVLLV